MSFGTGTFGCNLRITMTELKEAHRKFRPREKLARQP